MLNSHNPSSLAGSLGRRRQNTLFGRLPFYLFAVPLTAFLLAALLERLLLGHVDDALVLGVLGALALNGLAFFAGRIKVHTFTYTLPQAARLVAAVAGGALAARLLRVEAGLGPLVAAGVVGVLPGALWLLAGSRIADPKLKELPAAIYCGAFVGMSAPTVLATLPAVLLAGTLAGGVYLLMANVFGGAGGKLGTMAFSGVALTALLGGHWAGFAPAAAPALDPAARASIFAASMLGAVLTYVVSVRLKAGAVVGSAGLSLLCGLLFRAPAVAALGLAAGVPVAFVGATFAGMAAADVIPHERVMVFAGLFFGLIFTSTSQFFGGFGGGLGTTACLSVVMTIGLMRLLDPRPAPRRRRTQRLAGGYASK